MSQLSPSIQAVLELFQGPLAELRFAEVDAAALNESASEVEKLASAVAEQEARLTELRQSLTDRQDALLLLAQRALAYARIYAEHEPELSEQLSRITLPKASKPRKPNAKAAGSEPALSDSEASATPQLFTAESPASPATEAAADPTLDAASFDETRPDVAAPRANKRRARVAASAREASSAEEHSSDSN
ncbi:MAG TPA: hypothetical protein VFK05_08415 [Polyangiaceae bacterium]|nr:hypothetical protein [Polyangiaceae bacterium]